MKWPWSKKTITIQLKSREDVDEAFAAMLNEDVSKKSEADKLLPALRAMLEEFEMSGGPRAVVEAVLNMCAGDKRTFEVWTDRPSSDGRVDYLVDVECVENSEGDFEYVGKARLPWPVPLVKNNWNCFDVIVGSDITAATLTSLGKWVRARKEA